MSATYSRYRIVVERWNRGVRFNCSLHSLVASGMDVKFSKNVIPNLHVPLRPGNGDFRFKGQIGSTGPTHSRHCHKMRFHTVAGASPRQMADLEERVWSKVGSLVQDPEININLGKLGWIRRGLAVSSSRSADKPTNATITGVDNTDGGVQTLQLLLQLPTLLHPSIDELKALVRMEAEKEVAVWVQDHGLDESDSPTVNVEAIAQQPVPWTVQTRQQKQDEIVARVGPGLANVAHFVAVYSCKGGVGKSTVAVNLAYELARRGGRVGLLDVDVYGPSLPVLVQPDDPAVRKSSLGSSMVRPIEHRGVKMLSLGFVSPSSGVPGSGKDGGAAILRGPMAGRVVTQLLKGTEWGDLDVLILDLPPGTGDVQLTVCQEVDLSFAVGVTTPSKLAIADARKGIAMFATMGIDTVAMVENMSYFQCESGIKHYPFGSGFAGLSMSLANIPNLDPQSICQLPISELANDANETGIPICLSRPEGSEDILQAFDKLARTVSRELFRLPYRSQAGGGSVVVDDQRFDLSSVQLAEEKGSLIVRFFSEGGALQKRILPKNLRCRDPKTGLVLDEQSTEIDHSLSTKSKKGMASMVSHVKASAVKTSKSTDNSTQVIPERVEKKSRVGFEVTWSDGARFIYTQRAIAIAAGGVVTAETYEDATP
jgi:Mrp family chromosome partitioning ATPase